MPKGIYKRVKPSWHKGRKLSDEHKGKVKEALMGHIVSEATRKKIGKANKGRIRSDEFKAKLRKANLGKKISRKHKRKLSEALRGEKGSNWKGGITPLAKRIRGCFRYRLWISDVFTRDDFTCQRCSKRGGDLEAHHLKGFATIIEENQIKTFEQAINCAELWNINNGITYCVPCHKVVDDKRH